MYSLQEAEQIKVIDQNVHGSEQCKDDCCPDGYSYGLLFGIYLLFHFISPFHKSRAEGFRKESLFSVGTFFYTYANVSLTVSREAC